MTTTPPDQSGVNQPGASPSGASQSEASEPGATANDMANEISGEDLDNLLRSLRRKEGTWLDWGTACQTLQKAGYTAQQIFEASGFEPIQQNQIIVATQVYSSIAKEGISELVRSRFERTASDSLYEFRILNQAERAAAATLVVEKGIDSEGSREVAKALKEFSRLGSPPVDFADYPGDAVAYYHWNLARQQSDLQSRSRLIANALRFASSSSARTRIEKLLTDFSVTRAVPAPRLPIYRLDTDADVPKLLPLAGKLPLAIADFKAAPMVDAEEPFGIVRSTGTSAWVPIPGWQAIVAAEDPIALLGMSDQLPMESTDAIEPVLLVVDRADRQWDVYSHFVIDQNGELHIQWFEQQPTVPLLGKVILIMRPKHVLDEDYIKERWQLDE